jgi:hypothetical protein
MSLPLFFANGRVGVNQPNPTTDVDVLGSVAVSGSLTVAGSAIVGIALGAVGSTPNANGASLTNGTLTLQPADATHPGVITAGAQALAGDKTLTGNLLISGFNYVSANAGFGSNGRAGSSQGIEFSGSTTGLISDGIGSTCRIANGSGVTYSLHTASGVEVPTVGQGFILKFPRRHPISHHRL